MLQDRERLGHLDLEASEMAIRTAMHQMGGVLLEKLLNSDGGGYRGAHLACSQGHAAEFVGYRDKEILTVVSSVEARRAYYHCPECQSGFAPKDKELDVVGSSFSPGVRRMMARVGAKEPFEQGRGDLEALAGVVVRTKQVERISVQLGQQVEAFCQREREAILSGKVTPLVPAVPILYIAIDGTGVPVVPRETEGRRGKDAKGKAKTREAKIGCLFTQTQQDDEGYPLRDENSTTYVGAIETAETFGGRIYAEAMRRGLRQAHKVVVLGDGGPWIWGIAAWHFHGAIEIVDLYHAREHLANLGKCIYGPTCKEAKQWAAARSQQLDRGDVEAVITSMKRLRPRQEQVQKEVRKAIDYFHTNRERMRYAQFRSQGLFVGSGVVEAGCKTIIGQRLKQSGMRWTVDHANAIIALRCSQLSGRWEEFWEQRAALDSQPRQRNYCPSLFPAQWPLGRILGTTRRWLISGRFFTYKFGAHPLHALCYEHHVKMGMTGLVKQTAYACPKPDCSVRYSPSNGYFLAPEHGQVESYLTPRVTCPCDGQPMYLAEINREKRAFRLWRCPQCDASRTNEEGLVS